MDKISLLQFAKTLAGKFSNFDQAQSQPRYYSHINIYFRPLPWELLNTPSFYSEQSYDYSPWSPYRQGVHPISEVNGLFIIQNYAILNSERLAGGGFNQKILEDIEKKNLSKRCGCSMHFKELKPGIYIGREEPGEKCLIKRGEKLTYLKSEVELTKSSWKSLDRGFDVKTKKQCWGSSNGPLKFKRVEWLGENINENWIR